MLKRCPACKAKYAGKSLCHRCGLELSKLTDILRQADIHLALARFAYLKNDFSEMLFHAQRALSLRRTPVTLQVMACAAMLNQKFEKALALQRELQSLE
jgi:hypothetical protein